MNQLPVPVQVSHVNAEFCARYRVQGEARRDVSHALAWLESTTTAYYNQAEQQFDEVSLNPMLYFSESAHPVAAYLNNTACGLPINSQRLYLSRIRKLRCMNIYTTFFSINILPISLVNKIFYSFSRYSA